MISVAIDGPAGAGKSTLARKAAAQLGFIYVDTGALYRTVGLKFSKMGANTDLNCDIPSVLADTTVDIRFVNGEQRVFLDGEDVSEEIRTPVASMMASAVSAKGEVRAFLLEMQRKLARENDVLMDGRDIGTVVLPNATVKIFLTASAEERARRRYDELISKGMSVTFKEVYDDMVQRDYNDSHREIAPLKQAEDAVLADTTGLDPEQSLQLILNIVKERI
ncbi:MAG: (d)CMP kinase [Ruminococcaceae bacterium]|nr:(d)CMP kinase [Oscillospiraceae bacterium]